MVYSGYGKVGETPASLFVSVCRMFTKCRGRKDTFGEVSRGTYGAVGMAPIHMLLLLAYRETCRLLNSPSS